MTKQFILEQYKDKKTNKIYKLKFWSRHERERRFQTIWISGFANFGLKSKQMKTKINTTTPNNAQVVVNMAKAKKGKTFIPSFILMWWSNKAFQRTTLSQKQGCMYKIFNIHLNIQLLEFLWYNWHTVHKQCPIQHARFSVIEM